MTIAYAASTQSSCVAPAAAQGSWTQWSAAQVTDAATIIRTGQADHVPVYGQVIAVATAMQESDLLNLDYGDRDSLGLFQQRPCQGWGSPAQVMDPVYAAGQFYAHLLAVPGWQQLPLTEAAQDVQNSGFPDAYAQWQPGRRGARRPHHRRRRHRARRRAGHRRVRPGHGPGGHPGDGCGGDHLGRGGGRHAV